MQVCFGTVYLTIAHAPLLQQSSEPLFKSFFNSIRYVLVRIGICACAFAEQMKSSIYSCCPISILRKFFLLVFVCFACLIESEDTLNSYVVKEQRETNDTKTTHLLQINYKQDKNRQT